MTDLCLHCKTQPRAEGLAYCATCDAHFDRVIARLRREALDVLRRDAGRVVTFNELEVDDHNRDAIAHAQVWPRTLDDPEAQDVENGLFIWGPVGTGKSTLAQAVAHNWITRGQYESARFVVVRDLLADARSAMTRRDGSDPVRELTRTDPIRVSSAPSLLVLDDVGAERPTAWAREVLAGIIEHRYRSEYAPIVCTSNYSPSQLAVRLASEDGDAIAAQRIVSRLREWSLVLEVAGPDRRVVRRSAAA